MIKIKVLDIVGENCITMDDGQKVYDLIFPELKAGNPMELDFSGCRIFVSLFFNYAIGHLLKDFSSDELNRLLKISDLTSIGVETLKGVIANAKRYYSMDEETRRKVDEAILQQNDAA